MEGFINGILLNIVARVIAGTAADYNGGSAIHELHIVQQLHTGGNGFVSDALTIDQHP